MICDYQAKVDCKGAATPRPPPTTTEPPTRPTRPTRPPQQQQQQGGYPGQQQPGPSGYPGQQGQDQQQGGGSSSNDNSVGGGSNDNNNEESNNPNPPYEPNQPDIPAPINPYQQQSFAIRGRPTEFWQQRQAASIHNDLQQDLQVFHGIYKREKKLLPFLDYSSSTMSSLSLSRLVCFRPCVCVTFLYSGLYNVGWAKRLRGILYYAFLRWFTAPSCICKTFAVRESFPLLFSFPSLLLRRYSI